MVAVAVSVVGEQGGREERDADRGGRAVRPRGGRRASATARARAADSARAPCARGPPPRSAAASTQLHPRRSRRWRLEQDARAGQDGQSHGALTLRPPRLAIVPAAAVATVRRRDAVPPRTARRRPGLLQRHQVAAVRAHNRVGLGEPERALRALRAPRRGAGAPPQSPSSPILGARARHSTPAVFGVPRRLAGGVTCCCTQREAGRHVEPSTRAGTLEPDCRGPIRRRTARLAADHTAAKPATRARARRVFSSTSGW